MKMRNLAAIWPLFALKPKLLELRVERQEWNQEEEKFRNGCEQFENAREKLERLAPQILDIKRLVL